MASDFGQALRKDETEKIQLNKYTKKSTFGSVYIFIFTYIYVIYGNMCVLKSRPATVHTSPLFSLLLYFSWPNSVLPEGGIPRHISLVHKTCWR